MPEGPEVRRYADQLNAQLAGKPLIAITARTKQARAWLATNGQQLDNQLITSVRSYGKNLVGWLTDHYYFHVHLMMWGSWQVFTPAAPAEIDRRERARIITENATAVLYSAPIFYIDRNDPFQQLEHLATLGPDILPYPTDHTGQLATFDTATFQQRLLAPAQLTRTIGAVLLDQKVAAGIGNYLRAEILFQCRLSPWRLVNSLSPAELAQLSAAIPAIAARAYLNNGGTVTDELKQRMQNDPTLVYQAGREYGTRHYVFRRTNLPCLDCGTPIKQQRQVTYSAIDQESEDKTRIIYYCPQCQHQPAAIKPVRTKSTKSKSVSKPAAAKAKSGSATR